MITQHIAISARVSVAHAADILRVSRPYIYKLIGAGDLRVERYGPKTMLVLRESLLEWLRARGAHVEVSGDEVVIIRARVPLDMARIRDFCRRWHVTEFALFGSVVREDFRPESDVDVLVTFAPDAPVTLFSLPRMADELRQLFGREVDLVSRRGVEQSRSALRSEEILRNAEVVYHEAV